MRAASTAACSSGDIAASKLRQQSSVTGFLVNVSVVDGDGLRVVTMWVI